MDKAFPGHRLADQIEALNFAYLMLARTLHEQGQLDIAALRENLSNAEWIFQDSEPGILAAVLPLSDALADMQHQAAPTDHPAQT